MEQRFLAILGLMCLAAPGVIWAGDPIRVLVVTGGHDFEQEPFFEVFKGEKDITYKWMEYPEAATMFYPDKRSSYDVIVFYDLFQGLTEDDKAALLDLLKNGKGVVALHHCIASHSDWPEYEKIIAAKYFLKDTEEGGKTYPKSTYNHDQKMNVHVCDPEHPITKGIKDFTIQDETYGGFRVMDGVHRLLETDHPLSDKTIGWCHTYEKSKVVYIQLGHDHFAYDNPNYRRIVRQAIRWVDGKLGSE
ncbi:MAG: ThuA domain-containing protein [bacterium]